MLTNVNYCYRVEVTQIAVTVIVENVTLPTSGVTEIFNRVPVSVLESYFPSPFFTEEVPEVINVGGSENASGVRRTEWMDGWMDG
jgi:hypothetical protein